MPAYRFSNLEMRAIEYISRMPGIDVDLLAKLLRIPQSEAKKLKRKLSKILECVVVPNYRLLGWELLFVIYSTMPVIGKPGAEVLESCTHVYQSPEYFFATGFAQNYSELLRIYEKLCVEAKMQKKHMPLLIFPSECTTLLSFFEFENLLGRVYGNWFSRAPEESARREELDQVARGILYHIVQNPIADEERLSARLGVKRGVVKRKLNFLRKHGYYRQSIFLNLEQLGYRGFAFYHLNLPGEFRNAETLVERGFPAFFAVASTSDAILLVPYMDSEEIFETSVSLTAGTTRNRYPVSIVNYGYFQFEDLERLRENNYFAVLRRNRNFMFGDMGEGVIAESKRRRHKTDAGNGR
ncbi:MAG: hypothetical protein QXJ27_00840 [Thermoplasmata archaeon]